MSADLAALSLTCRKESWPLARSFIISRGAKTAADVVVAAISDGRFSGRGECVPYARYGETVDGVLAAIAAMRAAFARGLSRDGLQHLMPPGAARNALDCALWDYEAKKSGADAARLAGLKPLRPVLTAFTISLGSPEDMATQAAGAQQQPLLKLKLGGEGDEERLRAVRAAVPDARLIADANESWDRRNLERLLHICAEVGVEVVEQPLPAHADGILAQTVRPVAVCADESLHTRRDLGRIAACYDAVNIKLDKAGGLTEALLLAQEARARGLRLMAGCMVATSLAMAPALLIAQNADWVDLDGPLLLARDRLGGLVYRAGVIEPPESGLWG